MARQRDPGWYGDPDEPGHWRWWDGESWTEHAVRPYADAGPGTAGNTVGAGGGDAGGATEAEAAGAGGAGTGGAGAGAAGAGGAGGEAGRRRGGDAARYALAPGPAMDRSTPPRGTPPVQPDRRRPATSPGRRVAGGSFVNDLRLRIRSGEGAVFAKRWAALAAVVILFVIVLAVVFHSSPPALYWQGEPLGNSQQVLSDAQHAMQLTADSDEAALSSQSRCYFSLPNASTHDVAGYLRCGPVLLPWSTPAAPWFTYGLRGSFTGSAEKLAVTPETPSLTAGLGKGEVLRRPDGLAPPQGAGGLSVPVVPRQPESWGGVLDAPPEGLRPAPVTDLIGDWGQSYRLVASGDVERLSASLDEAALKVAVNPPGSAWATVAGKGAGRAGKGGNGPGSRPLATLLLPARGQVFVVAELTVSAGEDAGAVPTQASGAGPASPDTPQLEVVDGNATTTFADAVAWRSGNLTLVASVPVGSSPVLEVSDKGLDQQVSLTGSRLAPGPAVLSRAGTNDVLTASGTLPGVTVQVSDASLVWFAGSDGGTVPPSPDEAFLQILAGATPPDANVTASSFTLQLPGGQVVRGQALPDSDRQAIVVGFLVPASFSDGTVIVSAGGRSFSVPVSFP